MLQVADAYFYKFLIFTDYMYKSKRDYKKIYMYLDKYSIRQDFIQTMFFFISSQSLFKNINRILEKV